MEWIESQFQDCCYPTISIIELRDHRILLFWIFNVPTDELAGTRGPQQPHYMLQRVAEL